MTWLSIIPITVVAAVCLFFVKEFVEFFKKRNEKNNKILAYKRLLAEEFKVNLSALKFMHIICGLAQDEDVESLQYRKSASGTERLDVTVYGKTAQQFFWRINTSVFDKVMSDLAALDGKLFNEVAGVYEKLSEVKHVRESLIDFAEFTMPKHLIRGLGRYGEDKIAVAEEALREVFPLLSGSKLVEAKLRSYV